MQFNTYSYLLYLTVAVVLFWMLPVRYRRPYVLVASMLFYASWSLTYLGLPLVVCAVSFFAAGRMRREPANSRFWLWCGIGFVLAVLAFFKYRGFILENTVAMIGASRLLPVALLTMFVLPLGISFYSFEAVSYLLDTRQGRVKSTSFMDLCLFVMFWPHLIAGPIVRVRELMPQLKFDRPFDDSLMLAGLDRVIWGLVQKNLFANYVGSWVDQGFTPRAAALNTTVDNWFLAVAFGLQIYFDFAAYSNLAIGTAQLIGVNLPENFRYPYHAKNPSDFWGRWHMTLSRWIRDYVFFPLNARYKGAPVPLCLSLLGSMALVGLWHGAGWGFILWGVLHGFYLVVYHTYESLKDKFPRLLDSKPSRWTVQLLTLAGVTAAWVPFRASTLHQTWTMLSSMLFHIRILSSGHFPLSYAASFYLSTLLIIAFCGIEPYLGGLAAWFDNVVQKSQSALVCNMLIVRPAIYAFGLLIFMIFDGQDTKFIYFQF